MICIRNTIDNNRMIHIRHIIFILILLLKLSEVVGEFYYNKLNFSHKNLTRVLTNVPEGTDVTSVIKALYSDNSISALRQNDFLFFCQFPNLRHLYFNNNNISQVEMNIFDCLPELEYLDLSDNKLGELSTELYNELNKLRHLQYINLKNNVIRSFYHINQLIKKGIQIDYDGPVNQHLDRNLLLTHIVKNRKQRYISTNSKEDDSHLFSEDTTDNVGSEKEEIDFEMSYNTSDRKNNTLSDKYISSIIFNFFAASLVLVVIPLSMVIYYCISKCERCS